MNVEPITVRSFGPGLGLPVIEADKISVVGGRTGGKNLNVKQLIAQTLITTLIFLIIIIWFTIALNSSIRDPLPNDYLLFQFAVYFTVIAFFLLAFIIIVVLQYQASNR